MKRLFCYGDTLFAIHDRIHPVGPIGRKTSFRATFRTAGKEMGMETAKVLLKTKDGAPQ